MAIGAITTGISIILKAFDAFKMPIMLWFANRAGKKQGYKNAEADAQENLNDLHNEISDAHDAAKRRDVSGGKDKDPYQRD